MKWFSFRSLLISSSVVLLLISACSKDNEVEIPTVVPPLDDQSLPSAAILNIKVLEKQDDHVRFQMDVAVFRDSKNVEDQLKQESFSIDTLLLSGYNSTFQNEQASFINGGNPSDYSALMLMDQSGSISTTDPENYRLDAAKIFCSNLGDNNMVGLWSFANYSYKQLADFTTDTAAVIKKIDELLDQEGGSTPLYKSQYDGITYTHDHGTKTVKALLTFTDGEDTDYGKSSEEVITYAKNQGVRLYNIGLEEVNTSSLLDQSIGTGGAFMYAKDAKQLISIFGNLGKLLTNTAVYYQTTWTISSADNDKLFQWQQQISHELQIKLPYGGEITVPFSFQVD